MVRWRLGLIEIGTGRSERGDVAGNVANQRQQLGGRVEVGPTLANIAGQSPLEVSVEQTHKATRWLKDAYVTGERYGEWMETRTRWMDICMGGCCELREERRASGG